MKQFRPTTIFIVIKKAISESKTIASKISVIFIWRYEKKIYLRS